MVASMRSSGWKMLRAQCRLTQAAASITGPKISPMLTSAAYFRSVNGRWS
jgi:hypothetical protein